LPAAATTTMPAWIARSIARRSVSVDESPPRLRLITRVRLSPWWKSVAKSMPFATSNTEPEPVSSRDFTGRRLTL